MFDLSFFEIMVIAVVALIVIGPEKLPGAARSLGKLTGRAQRFISQVKEEVNREVRFEELQSLQGEIAAGVNKANAGLHEEVDELKSSFDVSSEKFAADGEAAISNNTVEQEQSVESTIKPRNQQKGSRQKAIRK